MLLRRIGRAASTWDIYRSKLMELASLLLVILIVSALEVNSISTRSNHPALGTWP